MKTLLSSTEKPFPRRMPDFAALAEAMALQLTNIDFPRPILP
ncbi:hypothetical protein [Caballeronia grimmiae]